jgi:hypothetical protein
MSTSHRNLFAEAWASAEYLEHTAEERKRIARLAVDLKAVLHADRERSKL